jgi:hypothetical protein
LICPPSDVNVIGKNSERLQRLRPVSFHLKTEPRGAIQCGLIAEEVDKVYPELVIRDDSGRIRGVRYEELAPILLSEMQNEREETTAKINAQAVEIQHLKELMVEMQAGLRQLQTGNKLVALR